MTVQTGVTVQTGATVQPAATDDLQDYLRSVDAMPLRDYVPYTADLSLYEPSCRGRMVRSEPDDDINYSVLSLLMLEKHGRDLKTEDVARTWLRSLPFGAVFTAEQAAYITLANNSSTFFAHGQDLDFDLSECSDNQYNDWIGAQI